MKISKFTEEQIAPAHWAICEVKIRGSEAN